MPPLEGDEEEVEEQKGLKILTPNKILQILYLLYQYNKITEKFATI